MKCQEQPQQKQTLSVWISSGSFKRALKQTGALVSVEVHASVTEAAGAQAGQSQSQTGE